MSGIIAEDEPTTCVRAREILCSLKQQREEISKRALQTFGSNSLTEKTVWRSGTTPTYEIEVVMPVKQKKSKGAVDSQSSSRSHELQEVVKERRENLLDMLKAASSCRTINSQQGSAKSSKTGRTDELSSMSPEDNHTSHSSESEAWAIVSPTPSLEAKGTASFTDESSSSSGEESRHHVILLPELSSPSSPSTSPTPSSSSTTHPVTKRWSREEFCIPRELCWSMTATTLAPNPCNGPRPKSKISLRGRYVSPSQIIAMRLGLGQHRLRKGSVMRKPNDPLLTDISNKKSGKRNKPPVVVVCHNEIVDDHQKRNMMLRSMMLDVIFLRRQYAQMDVKRAAAAKQAQAVSKYGLWGPYAKCFLSDDVSLACTSDSDTSGWFTDDDSTAAGTYGVEYSVAKKWITTAGPTATGVVKKNNKPAFTPPQAVTTRAMAQHYPTEYNYGALDASGLPSVEEEEEDDEDWIMPEDMSDQLCGAYGGMYFLYKKQRRVRLVTLVEV